MQEKPEFGGFRDNEEAFRALLSLLQQATDTQSLDRATQGFVQLRDHIVSTSERKSCSILLPQIWAILKNPRTYAKTQQGSRVSPECTDSQHSRFIASSQRLRSLAYWFRRLSNSFLRQWSFLCLHYLLILWVLGFEASINAFLNLFHMEISIYIVPIIRVTETCLVGVFCIESLALLILTAMMAILRQVRALRAEAGGVVNAGGDSATSVNPALKAFQQANAEQSTSLQRENACGRFTRDAVEMPGAFVLLGKSHSRFDAVSRDELPYWLTDPTNPLAEEYFEAGADLVPKGKKVTRIFLLSGSQMHQHQILKEVLLKHLLRGIGFAVVSMDHLPTDLKICARELDFALWDLGDAYSVFPQVGGYSRKMGIVFYCDGANADVAIKLGLYKQLLIHAWLVDKVYADCQANLVSELLPHLMTNNDQVLRLIGGKMKPEGNFFVNVDCGTDLNEKVDKLLALWTLTQGPKQLPSTQDEEKTTA